MNSDPDKAVEEVRDLHSLIEFLGVLGADWRACSERNQREPCSPHASMHGWENISIGDFLEAMQAWSVAAKIQDEAGANPYRIFARQLQAGKGYE